MAFSIFTQYYGKVSAETGLFRDAVIYEAGEFYFEIIPRLNMIYSTVQEIEEERYKEKNKK